jgi:hypothetical protein
MRVRIKESSFCLRALRATLAEFPALAMKAFARQPMAALTTIQLRENAARR